MAPRIVSSSWNSSFQEGILSFLLFRVLTNLFGDLFVLENHRQINEQNAILCLTQFYIMLFFSRWFRFMGRREQNPFVPFNINYFSSDEPIKGFLPFNGTIIPCNAAAHVSWNCVTFLCTNKPKLFFKFWSLNKCLMEAGIYAVLTSLLH